MPGTHSNKGIEAALATKLVAGTQKHLASAAQLFVDAGAVTPAQAIAELEAFAALRADVESARAVLKAKLADEKKKVPALRTFYLAYIGFVRSAFGGAPAILADFGLAPKKVKTPPTAEQLAAAAAKRAATRKARGTMGSKKKLSVKGQVTGVVVTPITAAPPGPAAPTGATTATSAAGAASGASAANGPVNGAAH